MISDQHIFSEKNNGSIIILKELISQYLLIAWSAWDEWSICLDDKRSKIRRRVNDITEEEVLEENCSGGKLCFPEISDIIFSIMVLYIIFLLRVLKINATKIYAQ